ncbi:MAG: phenylalanine--tRNA ligase subunit alpha [Acidobacteria bacterium]|nr:phenylalanine--tRNA ligase subunit alpha [Acidobacteriota bacterium]MBU4306466.1 phenylalanine--tRNA ligase subunit alpha [Acidobacteriota bacterium]MBU4404345.1 phenylalanine--tRNA ligase subunit alpha [Acidobacteriota bacterium]MCG2812449.1 phenylalanine--tRNA ligase subunit alpha [Candidatus Aminicenantes bacterium]
MIDGLKKEIEGVRRSFLNEIAQIQSPEKLAALKERFLSRKKGIVSQQLLKLRDCAAAEKPVAGQLINQLKMFIETELARIEEKIGARRGTQEQWSDCSLPASDLPIGRFHLIAEIQRQIEDIFLNLGYEIASGPEVELEEYNFTALNIPEYHPARDEQDTFFIEGFANMVLRTQTSPMQIRYMLDHQPPLKIISPGKVCRKDDPDATHTPVFHQVEGLLVDQGIHFSHLKGTLEVFCRSFFGPDVNLRFRPGYFPFTEPSAEVDISCFMCSPRQGIPPAGTSAADAASRVQSDCKVCKGSGWLEILGSGMVHPQVLLNCHIDPEIYSGFAFGMGIERVAMIKLGVPDLRMLYENDLRLLGQFG